MQQRIRTRGSSWCNPRRSAADAAGPAAMSSLRAACAWCFSASCSTRSSSLLGSRAFLGVAAVLLALAQEPRQLRGDGVPRGDVEPRAELVHPLLELLHVRLRVRVGRDGLGHLVAVALDRLLELAGVDPRAEQVAEPLAERERGARARRE